MAYCEYCDHCNADLMDGAKYQAGAFRATYYTAAHGY